MKAFIGLDTATVTGYAVYQPQKNQAFVIEVRGTPVEQLFVLMELINQHKLTDVQVSFEKMHNFRSATTTRSLLERYGFLKWTMIHYNVAMSEVSPSPARSFLGCKSKAGVLDLFRGWFVGAYLTSNHCDALAVALYAANQVDPGWGVDMPMISGIGKLELSVEEAMDCIEAMKKETR